MLTSGELRLLLERRSDPFRDDTWGDIERAVRNAVVTEEVARDMVTWKGVLDWKRRNGVL